MSMCMSSARTNDETDIFGRISFGVFYLNQSMPFGGVKASGHGRFGEFWCFDSDGSVPRADDITRTGGPEGLRGLCSIKSITEDRFFKWIRTSIPAPVGQYQCLLKKHLTYTDGFFLVQTIHCLREQRVGDS
jgi:hypothetical protein